MKQTNAAEDRARNANLTKEERLRAFKRVILHPRFMHYIGTGSERLFSVCWQDLLLTAPLVGESFSKGAFRHWSNH